MLETINFMQDTTSPRGNLLERLSTKVRRLVGREESGKDGETPVLETTEDEDSELSRPVDRLEEISENPQPSIVREEEDESSSDSFFTADGEVEEASEQPAGSAFLLTNLDPGTGLPHSVLPVQAAAQPHSLGSLQTQPSRGLSRPPRPVQVQRSGGPAQLQGPL